MIFMSTQEKNHIYPPDGGCFIIYDRVIIVIILFRIL
jgi:hypothetical protein